MAYGTPAYDYANQTNQLAQAKSAQDAASAYGRFMGQERFRRQNSQMNQDFRRKFPQVGQQYNQRGIYNSGLRKEGQQQAAQDFEQQMGNSSFEQAGWEQQQQMQDNDRNAQYLLALQQLFQNAQVGRASSYDPFAAMRPIVSGG